MESASLEAVWGGYDSLLTQDPIPGADPPDNGGRVAPIAVALSISDFLSLRQFDGQTCTLGCADRSASTMS